MLSNTAFLHPSDIPALAPADDGLNPPKPWAELSLSSSWIVIATGKLLMQNTYLSHSPIHPEHAIKALRPFTTSESIFLLTSFP